MADAPLLELKGITKRFPGVVANDSVDFDLRAGEVHALLGENGAGKSTLMNILYGLYHPDEGEIRMRGEPKRISSPNEAIDLGIGMVHQHFMLIPVMTVTENIVLGVEPNRGPLHEHGRGPRAGARHLEALRARRAARREDRVDLRRPAAARRDPEGALPRRRHPHPRRAHGGADAAGGGRAVRDPALAPGRGQVDHLHHPQAPRGARHRRPDHGPAARQDDRDRAARGRHRGQPRDAHGRARGAAARRQGSAVAAG